MIVAVVIAVVGIITVRFAGQELAIFIDPRRLEEKQVISMQEIFNGIRNKV